MRINDAFRYQCIGFPEDIAAVKAYGDFERAISLIDRRLKQENIPNTMRLGLCAQREMIRRTAQYYPYSRLDALQIIREKISDFTGAELDDFMADRKILWRYVNGEERIHSGFFSTLCKAYPEFALRAGVKVRNIGDTDTESKEDDNGEHLLDRSARLMRERGALTQRIRVRSTIRIRDEYFVPGMTVRVHLPLPAACASQKDIVIERISPEGGMISPETSLARTICWEEHMAENHTFEVEYSYTHTAVYQNAYDGGMKAESVQPDFCTEEELPHIVFTPYIRDLAASLTEGVEDPLEKARIFYDFITLNVKYAFVPAYFVLENLAETCARTYCGDCGILAMLFITLCRCVGIPAQWQSGLAVGTGFCGCHDWARFYVAPYGWLYADPSYGTGGVRANNEMRRRFYFGNLDPYRMVANNALAEPFDIEKQHWRADPYDNQMGEIETEDRGLDYPELECTMETISCEEM